MKCDQCLQELREDQRFTHAGRTLCEDCYLEEISRPQVCDPWAAYNAQSYRESMGLKGESGLTELQKALYRFIEDRKEVSVSEMQKAFDLSNNELMTSFDVLRHCGLVRAYKENGMIYLTVSEHK